MFIINVHLNKVETGLKPGLAKIIRQAVIEAKSVNDEDVLFSEYRKHQHADRFIIKTNNSNSTIISTIINWYNNHPEYLNTTKSLKPITIERC